MGNSDGRDVIDDEATAQRPAWRRLGRAVVVLDILLIAVLAIGVGVVAGAGRPIAHSLRDPIAELGKTFDQTGCASGPVERGEGSVVVCRDFTAITAPNGRALVVSVFGPGSPVVDPFRGTLPEGLAWGDTLTEVLDALGPPYRITDAYGTPTLVYMFSDARYGSLELRFNAADRLAAINACLTH